MDMSIRGSGLNNAAQKLQEAALENATPAGPRAATPEAGDVERFQAAYEGEPAVPEQGQAAQAGESVQIAPALQEGASMGDRILGGLAKVSDKIGADRAEVAKVLEKGEVNQADLLRAQFSMIESSTLISAVGKTAEKINQGIKTLQQG